MLEFSVSSSYKTFFYFSFSNLYLACLYNLINLTNLITLITLAAFLAALDAFPNAFNVAAFYIFPSSPYHVSVIQPISKNIVTVEMTSNQK